MANRVVGIRHFLDSNTRPVMLERAVRIGGEQLTLLLSQLQKSCGVVSEGTSGVAIGPYTATTINTTPGGCYLDDTGRDFIAEGIIAGDNVFIASDIVGGGPDTLFVTATVKTSPHTPTRLEITDITGTFTSKLYYVIRDSLFPILSDVNTSIFISPGLAVTRDGSMIYLPYPIYTNFDSPADGTYGLYLVYKEKTTETDDITTFKPILGQEVNVAEIQELDSSLIFELRAIDDTYTDAVLLAQITIAGGSGVITDIDTSYREVLTIKFPWEDGEKSLFNYIKYYTEWTGHGDVYPYSDTVLGFGGRITSYGGVRMGRGVPSGNVQFSFRRSDVVSSGYVWQFCELGLKRGVPLMVDWGLGAGEELSQLQSDAVITYDGTSHDNDQITIEIIDTSGGSIPGSIATRFRYAPYTTLGLTLTDIQNGHEHIGNLIYEAGIPAINFIDDPHKDWLLVSDNGDQKIQVKNGKAYDIQGRLIEINEPIGYVVSSTTIPVSTYASPVYYNIVLYYAEDGNKKDSYQIAIEENISGWSTTGVLLASVVNISGTLTIGDVRPLLQLYSSLWMQPETPPKPVIWMDTGLESRFVLTDMYKVDTISNLSSAWIMVRWGDQSGAVWKGVVTSGTTLTDITKIWPAHNFQGQYVTLIAGLATKRVKVSDSGATTLTLAEPVPNGVYDYIVGPHADEYVLSITLVDSNKNPIKIIPVDLSGCEIDTSHEVVVQSCSPQTGLSLTETITRMYQYLKGYTPCVYVKAQVTAINRKVRVTKSISDPAYILAGWGDPPIAPTLYASPLMNQSAIAITIDYPSGSLSDVTGFELYMDSSTTNVNPFLDESGEIDPTTLVTSKLMSSDKTLKRTIPVPVTQMGNYFFFVLRAFDGAGQRSDAVWISVQSYILKAPKPKFIAVTTGSVLGEEVGYETYKYQQSKGVVGRAYGINSYYIYATWGEKNTSRRTAKIIEKNKILISQGGGVKWVAGNFNDMAISLKDDSGNIETRKILSTELDGDGNGIVTVDADYTLMSPSSGITNYIIYPGTAAYVVFLQAKVNQLPANPNNATSGIYSTLTGLQNELVLDPQEILLTSTNSDYSGETIVKTEATFSNLPYGKEYRVGIAGIYSGIPSTQSEVLWSDWVTTGVGPAKKEIPELRILGEFVSSGPASVTLYLKINDNSIFDTLQICSLQGRVESEVKDKADQSGIWNNIPCDTVSRNFQCNAGNYLNVKIRGMLNGDLSTQTATFNYHNLTKIIMLDNGTITNFESSPTS